jgi:enolase
MFWVRFFVLWYNYFIIQFKMNTQTSTLSGGKITKVLAQEILDSRGNPTIQTTLWSGEVSATASVPSGASTGIHEALELRDKDPKRYGGLGVKNAISNVNGPIFKAINGLSVENQENVDKVLLELDGTENKAKLGANAILSVSLACARLASKLAKMELFEYLAQVYGYKVKALPTPLFNVINGGKHADSGLDVQEFFVIPQKNVFSENLRMGTEVFHSLKKSLAKQKLSVGVGDEGGFAPRLKNSEVALKQLSNAIKLAGYKLGVDFKLGMDVAASEFYNSKTKKYESKNIGKKVKAEEMVKIYEKLIKNSPIEIIEDGLAEDDFEGWKILTSSLGAKTFLVGDDLFVTNPKRIQMGIDQKIANAVLIKVNQIGSLTETMNAIKLAQAHNYKIVISHRSGETSDSFIADLATAVNAEFIKAGAPSRGERLAKYNRLLEIETLI